MIHLIVQASKYLMIFLFLVYTFECFHVFKFEGEEEEQKHIYHVQRTLLFLFHFDAFLVLYITTKNFQLIGFYLMQVIIIAAIIGTYHLFYKYASELVLNNMCMLLTIGFVILTRISFEKAFRQFIFVCAGFVISLLIPMILQNMTLFRKLTWVYVIVGVGALGVVAIAGQTSYGAKLSLSIGPLTIQPSEFVKIIFVMFIASMLYQRQDFHQVMVTSIFSAVFVLMLVASKDLGGALLYFFTYLVMVYVATRRFVYFGGGILAMIVASLLGYRLFDHVQARVQAWSNPLAVIDGAGYQVCQSLFAIGTGGWSGTGTAGKNTGRDKGFCFCGNLGRTRGSLCTVSDHGLCQLLFYDHECCHETSGQLLSSDSGRTWNTVCFAGVSDHRRGHQIYSVNRSDTSTGQLWRQFSVIDYDCVWHYTGTIHHAV